MIGLELEITKCFFKNVNFTKTSIFTKCKKVKVWFVKYISLMNLKLLKYVN